MPTSTAQLMAMRVELRISQGAVTRNQSAPGRALRQDSARCLIGVSRNVGTHLGDNALPIAIGIMVQRLRIIAKGYRVVGPLGSAALVGCGTQS